MKNRAMVTQNGADFKLVYICDIMILIVDLDQGGRSVTNDAYNVVRRLNQYLDIGCRRIFYRDSSGRFDEILTHHGIFFGFAPCTASQQNHLQRLACGQETKKNKETKN